MMIKIFCGCIGFRGNSARITHMGMEIKRFFYWKMASNRDFSALGKIKCKKSKKIEKNA